MHALLPRSIISFGIIALAMLFAVPGCGDSPTDSTDDDGGGGGPEVTAVYPVGAGPGTYVTIAGSGFGTARAVGVVRIGDEKATITSWADDEIIAVMPDVALNPAAVVVEIGGDAIPAGSVLVWEPGVIQLTNAQSATGAGEPTWSADGAWIYYTEHVDGQYDIFRIASDGGAPIRVTNTAYDENWPDISFQSGFVAFGSNSTVSGNTAGDYEIWVASPDFSSMTPVDPSFATQTYLDRTPAFSRDVAAGVIMAYSSQDDAGTFVIRLQHSGGLLSQLGTGFNPKFDPLDGTSIVFADYDGLATQLLKTTTTPGADRVPLSTDPETGGWAVWGVNGKIAYERSDNGRDIWIMDADGSNKASVISTPEPEYYPRWSPDASRIAFGSHRFASSNVFVFTMPESRPE